MAPSASSGTLAVVREQHPSEPRVPLLPDDLGPFREAGYEVLVEKDAGSLVGADNDQYQAAGARIVDQQTAWEEADLVLKYKAPLQHEHRYLRPGLHLCAFLHAEGDPRLVRALCDSGVTAYSYEFFQTADGRFPLAAPGAEISGMLAVQLAANQMASHTGGQGALLGAVVGVRPPRVVVIGHGKAGGAAARMAARLGAHVTVFGRHPARLREFAGTVDPRTVRCRLNEPHALADAVTAADVVIGAILISNYDTPPMITDDLVQQMKPGAIIVDVTAGYGPGYLPTCHPATTPEEPFRRRHGVFHCKIDTMPRMVPLTITRALSPLIARHVRPLADSIRGTSHDDVADRGCVVREGRVVNSEVRRQLDVVEHARG